MSSEALMFVLYSHGSAVRLIHFFFFQAEDGIRDLTVTGVQTCALPIFNSPTTQKSSAKPQTKVSDSGKVYVVTKGDNPVTIAKKFKVSYDDLLALNHIDRKSVV